MSDDHLPPSSGGEDAPAESVESIYGLLEDGEILEGLEMAQALALEHPGDGEVALAHAAAAYEAGFSREALGAAENAGKLGTREEALQEFYMAASLFRLWEFDQAREHVEISLRIESDFGDAWYLLAQIGEMQEDEIGARRGYEQAFRTAPDRFPRPLRINEEGLEQVIGAAVEELPEIFAQALEELPVIVQPLPHWEMVLPDSEVEEPFPPDVLGLFVGSNRLDRSVFNPTEQPGVIFLFQKNLERICFDMATLEEEIRLTVWHELAHYLGFDEEDMEDMGLD